MKHEEIAPSVWQFDSGVPGSTLLILGGIHGNERTGIDVVRRLVGSLSSGATAIRAGTVTLALGNLGAIHANVRFLAGRDLNRMFTPARLASLPDGTPEDARVRVLAPLIAAADVTLDLHATNRPSEPFIASLAGPTRERLFRWLRADRVLADPNFVLAGEPATTDEYAESCGRIGICYETGHAADVTRVDAVFASVVDMLAELGMIDAKNPEPTNAQELFEIRSSILLDERPFRFVDPFGATSFVPVRAGDTVAWHGEDAVIAEEDGVMVFQKIPEHWQVGKPLAYFARRIES